MTYDEQPAAPVDHLSHIPQCAACGVWSQHLNKITQHCHIEPPLRRALQDIGHLDLHAVRELRLTHHSLRDWCNSWQFDDRSSEVATVLAGCNGDAARTATHIEQALEPFKVVGCGQLSAGGECAGMEPAKEGAEF